MNIKHPLSTSLMSTFHPSKILLNSTALFVCCAALPSASAQDVFWNGSTSSNWSVASNWTANLPSTPGTANTIINPGNPNNSPEVSTTGNSTVNALYLSIDAGLSVVAGGSLDVGGWLVTGQFGQSRTLDVSGGSLSVSGALALGNGGYQGNVNISGGSLTANGLSINTGSGSIMNLGGVGSFVTPTANLNNVLFWVTNSRSIRGFGNTTGWWVNIDTNNNPGNVVLTAAGLVDNLITTYTNVMNYAGPTVITNNGTLTLGGGDNRLSISTNVVVHSGKLDLGGNNQTVTGLTGQGVVTNASGGVLTVNLADSNAFGGVIAGAGGLVKSGAGTLTLSGGNAFSGGTTLNQGVFRLEHASAAGSGAITQTTNNSRLQINTTGTVVNAMSIFNIQTLQTVTLSGNKTLHNATYTVDSGTTTTESGNLTGDGGITKQGAGTLLVTGSNTFTGAVAVDEGVLELASTIGGAAANSSSLSLTTGATLLISQSNQVYDAATVSLSGGTIQRGSGVSEVFGALTVSGPSALDFGSGTAGNLTFGTYTPSSLLTVDDFFGGNTLVFGSDLSSFLPEGTYNTTSFANSYFAINSISGGFTASRNGSTFTITAIPEPSSYLAAAGLLAVLIWTGWRPDLQRRGATVLTPASPCHPGGLWLRSRE